MSYSVVGNVLTATIDDGGLRDGTALFKVEITNQATGAYTVTLLDNVLHAGGPNDENAIDATVGLAYTITDADGSSANGTLTVTFDDDAPTATAQASQNVDEGATVTGTLAFVPGADGATVTHINGTALIVRRRRLLAGDRHRRRLDQGEGGRRRTRSRRTIRRSARFRDVGDVHGDGRRWRHGDGVDQLPGDRRQRSDRAGAPLRRLTTMGCLAATRRA